MTISRINQTNWIRECTPLSLLSRIFIKNAYIKGKLKLFLKDILQNRRETNLQDREYLNSNILNKYIESVEKVPYDLIKKDNYIWTKILSYFSEEESNYGFKLLRELIN